MSPGRSFVRSLSPSAPAMPTTAPLIVFDGVCVLCCGLVRWVMARDRLRRFRFTPAQGALGQALYRDLGLDPADLATNLLVENGVAYGKLRAVVEIAVRLGGAWRAAVVLRVLPAPLGDWAYDRVARNRYALFGRRQACWLAPPDMAERMI